MHLFTAATAAAVIVSAAVPASAIEIGNVVKSQDVQWSQQIQGTDLEGIHVTANGNIIVPTVKVGAQQTLTVTEYSPSGAIVNTWQKTEATALPLTAFYKDDQLVVMPKAQKNIQQPIEIKTYNPKNGELLKVLGVDSNKNIYTINKGGAREQLASGGTIHLTKYGVTQVTGDKAMFYPITGQSTVIATNPQSFETVGYGAHRIEVIAGKGFKTGKLYGINNTLLHTFISHEADDYSFEDGVLYYNKYVNDREPQVMAYDTHTAKVYDAGGEAKGIKISAPRVTLLDSKGLPIQAYERLTGYQLPSYSYFYATNKQTYALTYSTADLTYYVEVTNTNGAIEKSIPVYRKSTYGTEEPTTMMIYGNGREAYLAMTTKDTTKIYRLSEDAVTDTPVVPARKDWVVTFSKPLKENQALANYISIKNSNGLSVATTHRVSPDGLRLYIHAPDNGYAVGSYTLTIHKGLLSDKGIATTTESSKKFNVK